MDFYEMFTRSILVVVDVQNGFSELCPEELPVPGTLDIIGKIDRLLGMPFRGIYATQDWHPADHSSFLAQGGPYPPHCVTGTFGAEFVKGLWTQKFHGIFRKGFRRDVDSYSAANDHPSFVKIHDQKPYEPIFVVGVCTNICVYETACDLRKECHDVRIIEDACACLELPNDHAYNAVAVKQKAKSLGIKYVDSSSILPPI